MALTDNLVAYWSLDEASGNATDQIGSFTLTDTNTVGSATGVVSNCRLFNGTDEQFEKTGTTPPLNGSNGPFTISFWFKTVSTSQSNKYLYSATSADGLNQTSIIYEYVNDKVEFYSANYTGTDPRTGSGITISDTSWHHIVYRKDNTGSSEWAYFLDNTKTVISAGRNFTLPSLPTRIYMGSAGGVAYCNCNLDEFGIWTRSLSDSEISQLYGGGSGFAYPFTSSTVIPVFMARARQMVA